ncbi:low molecular weight phosphatase family protein [Isoptericola sp. NEAU-Y5]|uniref:Low molecular weight phosphatase family protein n=1 Tax=Isoptericola luteus TaxID=2879484 RepID=A0ABS7ZD96_9MICO|nr:low molecular weight phosphatase family protein [Isoptericola sp. NEAU-Y5]MCA5893009.1 low molecular weight phosphatase family protein [Isoptericola sp. NEAU-Y5]
MTYGILVVCTGNICRSAAAEHLLARGLDDSVAPASAGTQGLPGWPVDPPVAARLAADGIDASAFRSRPLTAGMMAEADLVLTLTGAHRAAALELYPARVRQTLTLGELSRLASTLPAGAVSGSTDAERLAALVEAALARRPLFVGAGADDDVPDPYRRPDDEYERAYAQLSRHVDRLLTALHG